MIWNDFLATHYPPVSEPADADFKTMEDLQLIIWQNLNIGVSLEELRSHLVENYTSKRIGERIFFFVKA